MIPKNKRILKRGEVFNNWEVIDPKEEVKGNKYYVLCYSELRNELKYVLKHALISGENKGKHNVTDGWSTRYKYKNLPKYVYPWKDTYINYRVAYKEPKTNKVHTLGYFYTLNQAKDFAQILD